MRADAHYVEQLSGRRSDRERVYTDYPRSASSREPEATEAEPRRDRRGDRVLTQVAEETSALDAAMGLLTGPQNSPAYRVGLDLVRLHASRAKWLSQAQSLLDGGPRGTMAMRPVGILLMQLRDALASECRIAGVTLQLRADDWNASVLVNDRDVLAGLTGAVFATMAQVAEVEGAAIRLTITVTGDAIDTVEVSQDVVAVPHLAAQRFFDLSWLDRPGGWPAAFAAAAARALAQRDGGSATFVPGDRRGGTMRLNFKPSA